MGIGLKRKIMERRKRRRKRKKKKRSRGKTKILNGKRKVSHPGMKAGTNRGTQAATSLGEIKRQTIGGRKASLLEKLEATIGGRKTPESRGSTDLTKTMTVAVRDGKLRPPMMVMAKKNLGEVEEIKMIAAGLGDRRNSFVAIRSS